MKIYTSYFGNLKKLEKNKIKPVGVAVMPPKWFYGPTIFDVAPTREMVTKTKEGKMSIAEYDKRYKALLSKVNPQIFIRKIEEISQGKDVALLCYEKNRKECHRDMLAQWIEEKTGIRVDEFMDESDKQKEIKERNREIEKQQGSLF